MINSEDFAVIIGISHYPHFQDLESAAFDARAFANWLMAPSGGNVPEENIKLFTDTDMRAYERALHPTLGDVNQAYMGLSHQLMLGKERIGRRLYLYMAGNGFGVEGGEIALLMPNATMETPGHSLGTRAYADYFLSSGAFDEIVLFVDCARTKLEWAKPSPPPWISFDQPSRQSSAFFYAFATQHHKPAFGVKDNENEARGLFTRVLLEGLMGKAAGPDGKVTSETLSKYVYQGVIDLSAQKNVKQVPEFITNANKPIIFTIPDDTQNDQVKKKDAFSGRRTNHRDVEDSGVKPERKPTGNDQVAAHADEPAEIDELSRRPFAEVIGARIRQVWNEQHARGSSKGAFMIHINGPWGIGKTSVLNFLQAYLQDKKRPDDNPNEEPWVVVEFNAWRHQRIRPPWWTLIKEIYINSSRQLNCYQSLLLRFWWLVWRMRVDLFPTILAIILILLVVLLTTGVFNPDVIPPVINKTSQPVINKTNKPVPGTQREPIESNPEQPVVSKPGESESKPNKQGNAIELGLKIITAALAAWIAIHTYSRSLVFGSARAAQLYTELSSDPLSPIVRLFGKLIKAIHRPVVVFIDDLDRCESKYVVELLEGIQTLFRSVPLVYVVAADRKWICASFEKGYEDFCKTIEEPGRPLGYLFLDKIFQVSTSVPHLTPDVQNRYWQSLLQTGHLDAPQKLDERRKQEENAAMEAVKNINTQEGLEIKIAEVSNNPMKEQAMRAAAAKQITSTQALRETEHRLQSFANLLEPNPRSMKRLVNTYGLHQATHFLEGRRISPQALACWTIIELRWPLLADFLTTHPHCISHLTNRQGINDKSIPDKLKSLFGEEEVWKVVGSRAEGNVRLDETAIRKIIG